MFLKSLITSRLHVLLLLVMSSVIHELAQHRGRPAVTSCARNLYGWHHFDGLSGY